MPTKLVDTDYLETASDDWFVDSSNHGFLQSLSVEFPCARQRKQP